MDESPTPPPIANTETRSDGPRACRRCGYDIAGLDPSGRCPECGFEVERSLASDELKNSSPEYVASLHHGLVIVLAAITASIVFGLAFIAVYIAFAFSNRGVVPAGVEIANQGMNTLIGLALIFGWWKCSAPDPAYTGRADGSSARKVLRVALVVALSSSLATLAILLLPFTRGMLVVLAGLSLLSFVVFAVRFFAEMRYIAWISARIPNWELHANAKRLMWLGPVLYIVGAACFGIGPIVAMVLYIVLLNSVRRDIKTIREAVPDMRG